MEEKEFQELFLAVHKKDIWEIREKRIKTILAELMNGEFKDEIQERRFIVKITKLKPGTNARIYRWEDPVIIELNSERWKRDPGLCDRDIKETLRHELLHVAFNVGDDSPLFKLEAKRRKIGLNLPHV